MLVKNKFLARHLIIAVISSLFVLSSKAQHIHLSVGDSLPAFSLYDQDGHLFDTRQYVGKKILVIYFYPKDESTVCTKEACAFRDKYTDFSNEGAMVIGINGASSESHKKFQQDYKLPFLLLSDPGNKVLKQFGVKNKFFLTGRETFVVGMDGKIQYTFNSFMEGSQHASETLNFIKSEKK
jgi:peroxiredoxin Q/BCP